MCRNCCTHAGLFNEAPCHKPSSTLHHIAVFILGSNGVLFPGERVTLDIVIASALRLISTLQTTGLPAHPTPNSWLQSPSTTPINQAFAILSDHDAHVGAIAVFDPDISGSSIIHHPAFTRVRVQIVGRFFRVAPLDSHAPFPCAQVRLLCDSPTPRLVLPLREAFPYLHPAPAARRKGAARRVRTRAAAAATASALPHTYRRRSSAFMGGLDFFYWRACTPHVLARRARHRAMYSRLDLDRSLIEWRPDDGDCPAVWSFWLCAALPVDTDDAVLHQLLEMSCVITRLRRLIQLFQSRPSKLRKRLKAQLDDEKLYRPSVSRKKARHAVSRSGKGEVATLETPPRKTMESRDCGLELVEQLRTRPWPSSPAKGFQQVDVSSPVKGRFRISLSSMSDAAQEFQEEDVSSPAEDRFRISLPCIIDTAEDEVNNPSTKVTTE